MYRIKRFSVLKTSTVVALMYMVIVAIFVVPFLLIFAIAGVSTDGGPTQGTGLGAILGVAVVAIFGYGLFGWVFAAIACLIYNLVASWIGGIEVQVEIAAPAQPPPAWLDPGTTGSTAPPPPSAPPTDPMVRAV